ncbi:MAG TPA: 1-acyl-sn-glycerol-3-phosphate acyltransferase, partial [Actinomycetota bacterium]|nr:1-acyl-sn-glycerol-3-phosphate acyltransferase [Actinomycetota bacterium]
RVAAARAAVLRAPRRSLHARVRGFAGTRPALLLAFGWGAAEALVWPIVPDLLVAALALAAPRRAIPIAAAAVAGSVAGGLAAYGLGALGAAGVLDHVPLVTGRMQAEAASRMTTDGAAGVLGQPWSGIPFKVFAYQAPAAGVDAGAFAVFAFLARAVRFLQVAAMFAAGAILLRRWIDRLYAWTLGAVLVVFYYGLSRVVAAWS